MAFVGVVFISSALGSMYSIPIGCIAFGVGLIVLHVLNVVLDPDTDNSAG